MLQVTLITQLHTTNLLLQGEGLCLPWCFVPATHYFLEGIYLQLQGAWHKGKRLFEFALGGEQSHWLSETVSCLAKIHTNRTWMLCPTFPAESSCCQTQLLFEHTVKGRQQVAKEGWCKQQLSFWAQRLKPDAISLSMRNSNPQV